MTRVLKGVVLDAQAEADRILAEARGDAAALREGAGREAEALLEAARARGRADAAAQVAAQLVAGREALAAERALARDDLLKLAVRIAGRLLERELEARPEAIAELVDAALADAPPARAAVVRVHPVHLRALEALRDRRLPALAAGGAIELRPDATLDPGGCVVETELGELDARLETQLGALEAALLAPARAPAGA